MEDKTTVSKSLQNDLANKKNEFSERLKTFTGEENNKTKTQNETKVSSSNLQKLKEHSEDILEEFQSVSGNNTSEKKEPDIPVILNQNESKMIKDTAEKIGNRKPARYRKPN